jgi:hypothetical protein
MERMEESEDKIPKPDEVRYFKRRGMEKRQFPKGILAP